ncbi:MAG: hypothetical protein H8F28_11255, partial [Fibrella sp.]|nr:hypothetical protein [Armatimonadota bacterium]
MSNNTSGTSFTVNSSIPKPAVSAGDYKLDEAIDLLRDQWRNGKQIVVLVGAGISAQSGFPSLGPLGIHLLTLYSLLDQKIVFPLETGKKGSFPKADAFSLEQMGWSSPCLFPELFGTDPKKMIIGALKKRFAYNDTVSSVYPAKEYNFDNHTLTELTEFADKVLGLSWYTLLDSLAESNPQMIDDLFDSIGTRVVPGAAHNLLSQFVSWMNVRLVLTTNFDSLIEKSLAAEDLNPYVLDVHINAPPPAPDLVKKHLSVIKLHGSHYGIRADRTIDAPLDTGHRDTMVNYFDDDAVIVVMDYGGGDRRIMDMIRKLMQDEPKRKIVRVDALATMEKKPFFKLADDYNPKAGSADPTRVYNLFYPHSRFFLLDVLQKCSGKLPNTQSGYPTVLQTPVPHKTEDMFGRVPRYEGPEKTMEERYHQDTSAAITEIFNGKHTGKEVCRFAVVTGKKGNGVSQVLSQIAERLYLSHQLLWCDLDEAVSVGTLVAWIYRFILSRQPELPNVPMPLELPQFEVMADAENELRHESLARTASALWNRMKRDRYFVVLDSISYAIRDLCCEKTAIDNQLIVDPRLLREAKRLVLFIAMLAWCASRDKQDSYCVLTIGTHILESAESAFVD